MINLEALKPKLRAVDPQPLEHEGMDYLYLRDPLSLSGRTVLVPQPLIPVLTLCDGSRTLKSIQNGLAVRYNLKISLERLQEMITVLDEGCLLEGETYQAARATAQAAYHAALFRPPAMAAQTYPEHASELNTQFAAYMTEAGVTLAEETAPIFRGLLSPHIDYQRGWPIYAQTWAAAALSVHTADLAIILGTDHYSEGCALTLTRTPYATPLGVLPLPERLINRLASILGEEQSFAGELHHRSEHSIELAATWLHFIRQDKPIAMLPILVGQLETLAGPDGQLESSPVLAEFIHAIQAEMQDKHILIIAAGDLSHVGPAFGGPAYGPDELQLLQYDDTRLLACLDNGVAAAFNTEIETGSANNNVCGASPIYLMLRILGTTHCQTFGYTACPADQQGTSFVTIAGAGLY
jgi:AmmeMemoRadiSam system protein B